MIRACPLLTAILLMGQADLPDIRQQVDDRLGLLSPAVGSDLAAALRDLERTDTTQVVVLIVATTAPYPIEDYANRTFRKNGIGQKNKNNGALIVVARDDRRSRIEVGYGLEGRLTDALCSQIIRREMVPRFRDGDYAGGIVAGARAVIAAVKGEYRAARDPATWFFDQRWAVPWVFPFGIMLFVVIIGNLLRFLRTGLSTGRWHMPRGPVYIGGSSWHHGGSGWGGGGSGGGGGWSGGGGMSGGGGASGSW